MNEVISTNQAPAAVGTYSQAVKTGNLVFISGQIPLEPATMEMVSGGFAEQTHQVFKNLQAVCKAAGGDFSKVVKLNISVVDLANFATLNEIMAEYFAKPYPARAAVGVKSLPKGAEVEIEAIMAL